MEKSNKIKNILSWGCSILLIVCGIFLLYKGAIKPHIKKEDNNDFIMQKLLPGGVFEAGKYIEVDGVEILYNGECFLVKNNRSDLIRISCQIIGVKNDGTYDIIQIPSFVGFDKTQYERDKLENGWAVKKNTNLVRPGETLEAYLTIYNFNNIDKDFPENDVDGDGYLDIIFIIRPQVDEMSFMVSASDPVSEIYKLKD